MLLCFKTEIQRVEQTKLGGWLHMLVGGGGTAASPGRENR
jgi:hypothetical protein